MTKYFMFFFAMHDMLAGQVDLNKKITELNVCFNESRNCLIEEEAIAFQKIHYCLRKQIRLQLNYFKLKDQILSTTINYKGFKDENFKILFLIKDLKGLKEFKKNDSFLSKFKKLQRNIYNFEETINHYIFREYWIASYMLNALFGFLCVAVFFNLSFLQFLFILVGSLIFVNNSILFFSKSQYKVDSFQEEKICIELINNLDNVLKNFEFIKDNMYKFIFLNYNEQRVYGLMQDFEEISKKYIKSLDILRSKNAFLFEEYEKLK